MSASTVGARQEFSSIPSVRVSADEPVTHRHGVGLGRADDTSAHRRRTGSTRVAGRPVRRFANAGPDCYWEISSDS